MYYNPCVVKKMRQIYSRGQKLLKKYYKNKKLGENTNFKLVFTT
jgi:hypothetical protein